MDKKRTERPVLLNIFVTILGVVEVLCGILLVTMILLQKSRSHGAAAGLAFGAGMGESLFGAQATNILQKITVVLNTIFLVNTTLMAFLGSRHHRTAGGRSVTDDMPPAPIAAPASSGPMSRGPMEMSPSAPVSPAPAATVPSPGPAQQPVMLDIPAATPAPAQAPAPATPVPAGDADPKPVQP